MLRAGSSPPNESIRGRVIYLLVLVVLAQSIHPITAIGEAFTTVICQAFYVSLAATGISSYATLTTLGYGDITPVSMWARSVSSIEMIIGGLYLTAIMARLVDLYARGQKSYQTRPCKQGESRCKLA